MTDTCHSCLLEPAEVGFFFYIVTGVLAPCSKRCPDWSFVCIEVNMGGFCKREPRDLPIGAETYHYLDFFCPDHITWSITAADGVFS
jgi:hypothetical protein